MRFKGKIAIWFWGIYLHGTGSFVYQLLFSPKESTTLLAGLVIYELVFLPIALRNYVLLTQESLTVVFGFFKDTIKICDIIEVYETHNPLSSTAASLDRIAVKGRRNEFMCSVVDKAGFLEELKKVNPDITFK
ncbi:MAG: PH domain-containing protein [Eubacteriales bacterium]|nr:PH domain-containing protein [Eubacteriales bacterium]